MKEIENIVLMAYIVLMCIIGAFIFGRYLYFRRTRHSRIKIQYEIKTYRYIRFVSVLVIPFFIFGIINYIFIMQKGNLFAPYWGKVSLLALLLLLVITEIYYCYNLQPKKINRISNIIFLVPFTLLTFILNQAYFKAIKHPDITSSITIDLPFHGTWIASGAGATNLTNHHDRIKSQKFAIDIIKYDDNGRLYEGSGLLNEESHTFGTTIISPVDGIVVYALDSLPDVKIKERDKLAGNHIILQFRDTLFVALAHLKQGSIKVKVGDNVKTGDDLAQVGNSGNTDFPHLHIHVQDSPVYDIDHSKSYPIRFRNFQRMRYLFYTTQKNQFLLSNDIIKNVK